MLQHQFCLEQLFNVSPKLVLGLIIVVIATNVYFCNGQYINDPPAIRHDPDFSNGDVLWEQIGENIYHTTLTFSPATIVKDDDSVPCTFTTRLFNGSLPGPTIYMRPGNQYQVTLINELGPESVDNPTQNNLFKDPNTTNIHTHGLHLSGSGVSDNVFVKILPLSSYTYVYNIPCDHGGGLFWYHPHHHGSVSVQMFGGAAGGLVIEESETELMTLPDWYKNMSEIIMIMQAFEVFLTDGIFSFDCSCPDVIDYLFSWDPDNCDNTLFYTVNGLYHSTKQINSAQWYKFRFLHVDGVWPQSLYIVTRESFENNPNSAQFANCKLKLLSRDGIPVHGSNNTVPRDVEYMFFHVGQRADVAIMCINPTGVTNYQLLVMNDYQDIIFYIDVIGDGTSINEEDTMQLTPFEYLYRPNYIVNTLYDDGSGDGIDFNYFDITLSENAINGIRFPNNESDYLHEITAYSFNQWTINNHISEIYPYFHPFHMHLFPFQVIEGGNNNTWSDIPPNWASIGDFIDVLHGEGTIRFKADQLGGHFIMHCHIVFHSDQGSIANMWINGGCDDSWNDLDQSGTYPQCTYHDDVECAKIPTFEPTFIPTGIPSTTPSMSPSNNPTDIPSFSPSISPSIAPSITPSQTPSSMPSASPSLPPTNVPTNIPSSMPSNAPSNAPSSVPSQSPSMPPTKTPSMTPTDTPSNSPTVPPTNTPTLNPTNVPTGSPSVPPTNAPTNNPSSIPSGSPSVPPTNTPTDYPTNMPSNSPSVPPTMGPTNNPSMTPSGSPSVPPSKAPTLSPIAPPTVAPSMNPTLVPTDEPTASPSTSPSMVPSLSPTAAPQTPLPTKEPTRGFTEGECCHARENTDRMELRCNRLDYINLCLSRYNVRRCQWDFDNPDECPLNLISEETNEGGDGCCGVEGLDPRIYSRQTLFCSRFDYDISACLLYCDWLC